MEIVGRSALPDRDLGYIHRARPWRQRDPTGGPERVRRYGFIRKNRMRRYEIIKGRGGFPLHPPLRLSSHWEEPSPIPSKARYGAENTFSKMYFMLAGVS